MISHALPALRFVWLSNILNAMDLMLFIRTNSLNYIYSSSFLYSNWSVFLKIMHFSIPDCSEIITSTDKYTVYEIHINGCYHCSVRYSQLAELNEKLRRIAAYEISPFPPKKLFSLTMEQLDERRLQLEGFIQNVCQDPALLQSEVFNEFLFKSCKESLHVQPSEASLQIYLMNGKPVTVNVTNLSKTEDVLEAFAKQINIPDDLVYFFGIYMVVAQDALLVVRKLQDFECPFLSLQQANKRHSDHRLVVRKAVWDPALEDDLLENPVTLKLLFCQAAAELDMQWLLPADADQAGQLARLRAERSMRAFLRLCRQARFYGHVCLAPPVECNLSVGGGGGKPPATGKVDSPSASSSTSAAVAGVSVATEMFPVGEVYLGGQCVTIRDVKAGVNRHDVRETVLLITRMKSWRITTPNATTASNKLCASGTAGFLPMHQVSFEYLVARDKLDWIHINSPQAIFVSMCLQSMVDELLMRRDYRRVKRPSDRRAKKTATEERITKQSIWSSEAAAPQHAATTAAVATNVASTATGDGTGVAKLTDKMAQLKSSKSKKSSANAAFDTSLNDAIGDDDL